MSAHLSLTTDSRRYMNYLICLIVPSIIIWLILIPSIMYKMSKPEKSRLSYRSVQAYFNIMNVDYKRGYCYWVSPSSRWDLTAQNRVICDSAAGQQKI